MNTTRHRGPRIDWRPQQSTVDLLDQVNDVLAEYRDHLPLTARQIFYRLIGKHGYDKTEKSYSRLLNALVNARRSSIIDFTSIRDDGITSEVPHGYTGKDHFYEVVARSARVYRRDRQLDQAVDLEVWCEAAGMVPQMVRVAAPYGVSV